MTGKMHSKWHKWSIEKKRNDYRVMIIEPRKFDPPSHFNVFSLAMKSILGDYKVIDPYEPKFNSNNRADKYYDQIIFPEAFMYYKDFKNALLTLSRFPYFGCVHVGLRSDRSKTHLFPHQEVIEMIDELESVLEIVPDDVSEFRKWLESENGDGHYNLACMFAKDVNDKLRLCLHPKVVRSEIENNPLPENHMTEAHMYNLVVLEPENNSINAITIQPLICSDVLIVNRSNYKNPLDAVNTIDKFPVRVPNKIDIVSVVSCTPQEEELIPKSNVSVRKWHPAFRDSFDSMSKEASYLRHQSATFLISNYQQVNDKPYGLSGLFFPHALSRQLVDKFPKGVHKHLWGRFSQGADPKWLFPSQLPEPVEESKSVIKRCIVALEPSTENSVYEARALEFTISILPSYLGNQSRIKSYINSVEVKTIK